MGNQLRLITPDNFTEEVISEKRPILLLCMPQNDDFPSQAASMEVIAADHGAWLKTGLLADAFVEYFMKKLGVAGTPTYLIFLEGEEKDRVLGLVDHRGLERFVFDVMAQVPKRHVT